MSAARTTQTVLGVLWLLTAGCDAVHTRETDAAAPDEHAASSVGVEAPGDEVQEGVGPLPPGATCDTTCRDYFIATGLHYALLDLWGQLLGPEVRASYDATGDCPLGGTLQILGTESMTEDGTCTPDLQFELHACSYALSTQRFTFDGTVRVTGTYDNGDPVDHEGAFTDLLLASDALDIGARLPQHGVDFRDTCHVALLDRGDPTVDHRLGGTLCGRKVDAAHALDSLDPKDSDAGAAGSDPATDLPAMGNGVCVAAESGECKTCSSLDDCAFDETCCGPGFCTRQPGGQCEPCSADKDCQPGLRCCQ